MMRSESVSLTEVSEKPIQKEHERFAFGSKTVKNRVRRFGGVLEKKIDFTNFYSCFSPLSAGEVLIFKMVESCT